MFQIVLTTMSAGDHGGAAAHDPRRGGGRGDAQAAAQGRGLVCAGEGGAARGRGRGHRGGGPAGPHGDELHCSTGTEGVISHYPDSFNNV